MTEQELLSGAEKSLAEFRRRYREGLDELLDNLPLLDSPIPPDPFSMGIEERTFEELEPQELSIIKEVLFEQLGIGSQNSAEFVVREYASAAVESALVPGDIEITVFRTNKENIFLQELFFPDEEKRWVVGPDIDI